MTRLLRLLPHLQAPGPEKPRKQERRAPGVASVNLNLPKPSLCPQVQHPLCPRRPERKTEAQRGGGPGFPSPSTSGHSSQSFSLHRRPNPSLAVSSVGSFCQHLALSSKPTLLPKSPQCFKSATDVIPDTPKAPLTTCPVMSQPGPPQEASMEL